MNKIINKIKGAPVDKYYSLKRILKTNATYNIIFGKRSNGKTFSVVERALEHGWKLAYIRRFDEEITRKNLNNLVCADHDIAKHTHGQWNSYCFQSNCFYFTYVENGKVVKKSTEPFIHCFALNTMETTKGADNGYFPIILFDEFITRRFYLPNEFVLFQNILSSIIRDRDGSEIYMLANTVNQSCPYFAEMGLTRIDKMKQGEIQIVDYGNSGLRVAVEYCNDTTNTLKTAKYFAFDNPQLKMITNGKWEIKGYPHCPISVTRDNIAFIFFVIFEEHIIRGNIVNDNGQIFVFFNPHTNTNRTPTENDIAYSLDVSTYPMWCQSINETPTDAHKIIRELINRNKMYFSDNTTGEIIRNWLKQQAQIKQTFLS